MASSIRDFDPILRKRQAKAPKSTSAPLDLSHALGPSSRNAVPIKISVGQHYVKMDGTSLASFSKQLNDAFMGVAKDYGEFARQLEGALPGDLVTALEPTLAKAKYYCPKDTHELAESGYVEVRAFRGAVRAEIGFARGGKPEYAVFVHEMTNYKHEAPTSAKFLQRAIDEDYVGSVTRLANIISIRLGEGRP